MRSDLPYLHLWLLLVAVTPLIVITDGLHGAGQLWRDAIEDWKWRRGIRDGLSRENRRRNE